MMFRGLFLKHSVFGVSAKLHAALDWGVVSFALKCDRGIGLEDTSLRGLQIYGPASDDP